MSVFLAKQIDVSLGPPESPLKFLDIFFVDTVTHNRRHHERAVDSLTVSELLGERHHDTEQGWRPVPSRSTSSSSRWKIYPTEVQFDLFTPQNRLVRLDCGVVSSRLVTHRERDIHEVFSGTNS